MDQAPDETLASVKRFRHRSKHRRVSLGSTKTVDTVLARSQARRLLAEVALDGLPKRAVVKATPIMTDFVAAYWGDIARMWKASTCARNSQAWRTDLAPMFGDMRVADISRRVQRRQPQRRRCLQGDPCSRRQTAVPAALLA